MPQPVTQKEPQIKPKFDEAELKGLAAKIIVAINLRAKRKEAEFREKKMTEEESKLTKREEDIKAAAFRTLNLDYKSDVPRSAAESLMVLLPRLKDELLEIDPNYLDSARIGPDFYRKHEE
jgi:capsule polysaccharide export protein KpsE/RkpR